MTKKIFAIFMCAVMLVSFVTPLAAEDFGTSYLENRIRELEAQLAAMQNAMASAAFVDAAALNRQRRDAQELERYMFHMKYYGVILTIAQNDLLIRQRTLTQRQLDIENVRLELGFTTQKNMDDLTAMLNSLERQIESNNQNIRLQQQQLNERRGRDGYEFIGNYRIPNTINAQVANANALQRSLITNSVALRELNNSIDQAHGASWNALSNMHEQRVMLERQLEVSAISSWNAYQNAKAQRNSAVATRPLLQSRLDLIDEMFYLGEISEIDKLAQRFAIYTELHHIDITAILLAMSVAEVNMMAQGFSV
ncbi:MAG: TolC family protein [Defluviitaleaceae bacterium]|nr:TolC family protein [Defluviitaleaceae bacterium]